MAMTAPVTIKTRTELPPTRVFKLLFPQGRQGKSGGLTMDRCIRVVRGVRRLLGGAATRGFWLLVSLALASPAGATLKQVTVVPAQPTTCDSVTITVEGDTPDPCYEIMDATIKGPEPIPCMRPGPCPSRFQIEITVREP